MFRIRFERIFRWVYWEISNRTHVIDRQSIDKLNMQLQEVDSNVERDNLDLTNWQVVLELNSNRNELLIDKFARRLTQVDRDNREQTISSKISSTIDFDFHSE